VPQPASSSSAPAGPGPRGGPPKGSPAAPKPDDRVADQKISVLSNTWAKAGMAIGAVTLAVVVGMAGFSRGGSTVEADFPNYTQHVEPLQQEIARTGNAQQVRKVTRAGVGTFQAAVEVGQPLVEETQRVKASLLAGNAAAAQADFASMQTIPDMPEPVAAQPKAEPTLSAGMAQALAADQSDLYQLYMYDNCAEDGDVVDVYIDGARFATVPITHQGATLTVPIARGSQSVVSLMGVHDGGGGITVAFRSSEGDYFTRPMQTGEQQTVAVVSR